ncbi:HEAT repeat domain-containing protein [Planctomycetota bacterium]
MLLPLLFLIPSELEGKDKKKPGKSVEETIKKLSEVIESLASEQEKIKAIEELGKLNHLKSVEMLEDFLLFRWEKETGNSHVFTHPRRIKTRKLRQSRESVAKLRAKAAESLGTLKSERSIPVLIRVVRNDTDAVVREHSLKALLHFKDSTLISTFSHAAANDKVAANRIRGVEGISLYPHRIEAQTVKHILNDSNIMVRLSGIKALSLSRRKDLLPLIIETAYDARDSVRRRVADALSHFNTAGAAEVLLFLAQDQNKGTAVSAVNALNANTYVKKESMLKLASRLPEEGVLILLKGSYNLWKDLSSSHYKNVSKVISKRFRPMLIYMQRKVEIRQKTAKVSEQAEKLRIILTEWENECKL